MLCVLGTGWCLAWQFWWFDSTLAGKICSVVLPKSWVSNKKELMNMEHDELVERLACSDTPMFWLQLISCRYCITAHFSAACMLITLPILYMLGAGWLLIPMAPLVWACQAGVAILLYTKD